MHHLRLQILKPPLYRRYVLEICVSNFQIFTLLTIGSGQDLTFGLEWINGIYANNFTVIFDPTSL